MNENTYNILTRGIDGVPDGIRLSDLINLMNDALCGDLVFVVTPSTLASDATAAAWTRTVTIELQNAAGDVQKWFNKAITTGVSIADTSSAGVASIPSTTLTFVEGVATVVVSGTAAAWLGGTAQVMSMTVTGAPSSDGTVTFTITAAGMDNSPVDVEVELVALTHTTVTLTAAAIVEALNADEDVSSFFVASNVAGKVLLTAITPAANDATMAIAFADTDTTSTTCGAQADDTAGVAKETDTLTVAQASIAGATVAAKTSVETFS